MFADMIGGCKVGDGVLFLAKFERQSLVDEGGMRIWRGRELFEGLIKMGETLADLTDRGVPF